MKSGFISLIGRTNAGKSSIINSLLDEKITLVSHKQNATRRKISAIVMHKDNQLIFIDTPGLHKSDAILNQLMIQSAIKSIADCDLIVFVASVYDDMQNYQDFLKLNPKTPHIIVLNKVDLCDNASLFKKLDEYNLFKEQFQALIPFSCKKKAYKKILLDEICKYLPEHEYFFDPEFITNSNEKEIYRDFILESLYENFSDELPYSSEVIITRFKEEAQILFIDANIITNTNSHKAMLIGKNGASIKRLGKDAREKIQKLANKKVMLKLFVQVKKDWQKDQDFIKKAILND
ncbi:GTPase Era [Campylobacter sp. US33a]|uniref:GTPase Era n=1 Tax=Campylobacter sp. US33a TaxID=2498120 RepID=UPI00106739F6|nr:GTPase Era [Campylobacter sp. US33a]TEY03417.1 GTPase Era [Campylobacter sp. US33a]